jgi:predicted amidohydrolase YtcJ
VEDVDPIACYYAAVTRKMNNGEAFYPDQRMTREQAIYSYTMANALSSFQEKEKGSIEAGKYADLVLLDHNLITCPEEEIRQTKVKWTMVGGRIEYEQNKKQ